MLHTVLLKRCIVVIEKVTLCYADPALFVFSDKNIDFARRNSGTNSLSIV